MTKENIEEMGKNQIALVVPRHLVKQVKTTLEERNVLDRATKIKAQDRSSSLADEEPRMVIRTTIPYDLENLTTRNEQQNGELGSLLANLGLGSLQDNITIIPYAPTTINAGNLNGPYLRALRRGLESLPKDLLQSIELSVEALVSSFPDSYTVYKPMLLLPHNAFSSDSWKKLLSSHPASSQVLRPIWERLGAATQTTHVAVNAGIPPSTGVSKNDADTHKEDTGTDNILRSPVNLISIYGDFGPPPTPTSLLNPTASDFTSAFWVSQTQNGIYQTWAPLYTMFSRGNIREKTRLLTLPCVLESVEQENGCTGADLYAGIGYFAFSYKKAGVSKVLCWELNPWSIEGLRRGAERNAWTTQIFTDIPATSECLMQWSEQIKDVDFLVFQQSNEHALHAITTLVPDFGGWPTPAMSLPPIRHVNCGLLPSSKLSWRTAVLAIDREIGGWIHVHENVGIKDIDTKKEEVVARIQDHLDRWEGERGYSGFQKRRVRCEHVEKVKTYAPGVLHVVFDIRVDGLRDVA